MNDDVSPALDIYSLGIISECLAVRQYSTHAG